MESMKKNGVRKKDKHIARNYSAQDISGKSECRKQLLQLCGWNPDASWPVIGIVSRFASQKGFDLLETSMERLMSMHYFLVVLGKGEHRFERLFEHWRGRKPQQIAAAIRFDNDLAHKIEAGADMFLMPSRYEPCGLNQMYSLKYGTIPVVRATGGLDDTVDEWNSQQGTGNGFKFYDYSAESMIDALARARNSYENKDAWRKLMFNGMIGDYSWRHSAVQYLELYKKAVQLKR